jgi:hypothetical protein
MPRSVRWILPGVLGIWESTLELVRALARASHVRGGLRRLNPVRSVSHTPGSE